MFRVQVEARANDYVFSDQCAHDDREAFIRLLRELESSPYQTGRFIHGGPGVQVRDAPFGSRHKAVFVIRGVAILPPQPQVHVTHCLPV